MPVKPFTSTYTIKNRKYTITSDARFDENGKLVYDQKLDDIAKQKALDAFAKDQDYVTPRELKNFRKTTGLTQRELAKILGFSQNTLAMYEKGAIPAPAYNKFLKLVIRNKSALKQLIDEPDVPKTAINKINKLSSYLNSKTAPAADLASPFTINQIANYFIVKNRCAHNIDSRVKILDIDSLKEVLLDANLKFKQLTYHDLFTGSIDQIPNDFVTRDFDSKYQDYIAINNNISVIATLKLIESNCND